MFQPADCIHISVFILWPKPHSICHPLSSFSKHCLSDLHVCRAPKQLAQSGHEHYHDSLNIAYIISHVNTEFLDCFMGGLPALDTFPRCTCPQIIPHKLAFLRLAHLCTLCTDHPCSNCSENLPGCSLPSFSASFLNVQAELVFSCSAKNGDCFKFCSCTLVKIAPFYISCIAMPQQCTWTFVTYYCCNASNTHCK
jgi:hypothetical protein